MANIVKKTKIDKRNRRHSKIRSRILGTKERPRVSVFKSNKYVFVQAIDDGSGSTLVFSFSKNVSSGKNKTEKAKEAGKILAEKAQKEGIKKVVFDRGGFLYTGIVKAVSEGAREGGLEF